MSYWIANPRSAGRGLQIRTSKASGCELPALVSYGFQSVT